MRSHTVSNEAPQRGHGRADERRHVNVDVNVDAAGWPLGRHGKHSWSVEGAVANKAGNSLEHVEERHDATAQMSSGAEERSFDVLAHEVEELIERQPKFAFLKPCRQLEKQYTNKKNAGQCAGNGSFRHGGSRVTATEATAYKDEKEDVMREVREVSSTQRRDAHQKSDSRTPLGAEQLGPDHVGAKPRRESRRELQDSSKVAQCRIRDSAAKPGSTIRELLSTDVEPGLREAAPDHHVRVRKHHDATSVTSDPSPVSVSFKCEEEPGRPKSIAAAAQRALARKLSRDGIELNSFVEGKSDSQAATSDRAGKVVTATKKHQDVGQASPRRSVSERFYGRGHFHRNSGERIWRISSTRCSIHEKEAHIDLVAPAAAKFLVETSGSPLYTPARHYNASPPAVAVPFKWEDAPGRAKLETAARKPDTLQLPPRLAVPLQRNSENFSRELRVSVVSHPLAGLFPCMTASSPSRPQQHDPTWMHHHRASRSLPPKQSHPHHGYGGHQEMLPKSGDRCPNQRKLNKSFSQPLTSTDQYLNLKPRRLFSSELKASHPWMQQGGHSAVPPSDPTSILHGSRQSSSSRTYLSCELDASTPRTAGSKSSSSVSYESIGEDFDHDESASPNSYPNKPHSFDSQTTAGDAETPRFRSFAPPAMHTSSRRSHSHRSEGVKGLLKLCKNHSNCLGKSKSRQRLGPLCSPEVWAPTLATYFQRLDVNEPAMSSGLLDTQSAPTSSGYLNSKGEPLPLNNSQQTTAIESPEVSPERPTRLPYKMPSVAEQERAARNPHRAANLDSNSRAGRHNKGSLDLCPSPAYTAALEMLSPAVNLMASRRHRGARHLPSSTWPGTPKPHRRVQFILSICKTLKRVLFRQQPRRSVIGSRLMYHDERAPTTFQFSKPN